MAARKKFEQEIDELRIHLRILSRAAAASIVDYDGVDELLDQMVIIICEELGYDHFGIGLADQKGQITYRAGCGLTEKQVDHPVSAEGIVGAVFQSGKPLLVPDVRLEPRYSKERGATASELCVPLRTHKAVIGVINAESDRPRRFTSHDLELLTTIANVVSGNLERIINRDAIAGRDRLRLATLTPRERQVLLRVMAGKSNKQIARELKIEENTVEAHLGRIFIKLGVQSRTEAMALAEKQGLGHP